jgi:glucose-fructose oxidoreductase
MPLNRRDLLIGLGGLSTAAAATVLGQPGRRDRKVGYAIVGLGGYAMNQILPQFANCSLSKVTALVSGDPAKARKAAQQYGVPERSIYDYATFDRIRDNEDVDVVYVILPNSMHAEYTIRAAKAGKHVLCEKPMSVSVAEAEAMIAACRAAGRKLMIGYRSHFEPTNIHLMRLRKEQAVGRTRFIQSEHGFSIGDPTQWRLKRALAGGGSLMDIGIYSIQALRYGSGEEPTSVTAHENTDRSDPRFREVEDLLDWTFTFPSGALGHGVSSYSSNHQHLRLTGTEGWVDMEPATGYGGHRMRMRKDNEEGVVTPPAGPAVNQFVGQLDHMAECVITGRDPIVPGEEGLRDMRIIEAIYRSAREGRSVAL